MDLTVGCARVHGCTSAGGQETSYSVTEDVGGPGVPLAVIDRAARSPARASGGQDQGHGSKQRICSSRTEGSDREVRRNTVGQQRYTKATAKCGLRVLDCHPRELAHRPDLSTTPEVRASDTM